MSPFHTNLDGTSSAVTSLDGRYRYLLERRWDATCWPVLFIMLNPSTADAMQDDPTIRRCIGFAKRWGFGGLLVWNLYAYRATDPKELDRVPDPIGPENSQHLYDAFARVQSAVAAWGAQPNRRGYVGRASSICAALDYQAAGGKPTYCLGTCKNGQPRHPLYVRGDQELVTLSGAPLLEDHHAR